MQLQETLSAFDRFLQTEPLPGKHRLASENTRKAYLRNLRLFLDWFLHTNGIEDAAFTPSMITREDIRDYFGFLRTRGVAVATVHQRFAALSVFFKWAQAQGLASDDPTQGLPLPSRQPLAPKGLDRRDRRALQRALNTLPQDTPTARLRAVRDRAIVLTLMYVGLRVSELVGLRLDDITLRERSGEIVVRSGKGDKDRTAAVPAEARKALRAWLEVRPDAAHDFVFTQTRAPYRPLGSRAVQMVVREVGRLAGLEITPHTLRHTAVYLWKERNVDPFVIAAQMGHKSLDTTMRYGKPRLEDLRQAAQQVS